MDGRDGVNRISGGTGNDGISSGAGNDYLSGDDGDDRIYGGAGNDGLSGGDGNDLINGGSGSDVMDGGSGINLLSYSDSDAGVSVNLATGENSDGDTFSSFQNLRGGNYNDVLTGDAGNNVIDGRLGYDTLTGGAGADTFQFNTAVQGDQSGDGPPADTITDFNSVEGDVFDLRTIDADTSVDGDQAFHFIGCGDFTNVAGELQVVPSDDATPQDYVQIEGDINGDGTGDLIIQVHGDAGHGWTADDFMM